MAKKDDSLFLFEVLIDKVFFSKVPCFFDRDFKTCININFPAVEPIEICDDDTTNFPESKGPFLKSFNRGKSCLFSLNESEISSYTRSFPVKVTIYKALPCGCLPTKIIMGECTIDMTKEFMESRQKFLSNPNDVSYQALKDSFSFVGPDGTVTGEILMFLRISCFGNKIVTQFQGTPHAATPASGVIDRTCNPQKEFQTKEDPCACGATHGLKGGKSNICPPEEDKYNFMQCEKPEDPCYCSGPRAQGKADLGCRNTFPYCLHVPKDCCPTGNKVVFQMPTGFCDLSHKQRAHLNFSSNGIGDVSRDDPAQLIPISAENYPGYTQHKMAYLQDLAKQKNQSLTYLLRFNENTESSTMNRHLYLRNQFKLTHFDKYSTCKPNIGLFGDTFCVYSMSSIEKDYSHSCTSGTQATALLNKCLQVHDCESTATVVTDSKCCSACSNLSLPHRESTAKVADHLLNPQLYFWSKKKEIPKEKGKGMGQQGSKSSVSTKSSKNLKGKDSKEIKTKRTNEIKGKESKTVTGKNVKEKASKIKIKSAKSNTSSDSRPLKFKTGKGSVENLKTKNKPSSIKIKDEKIVVDKAAASTSKNVCIVGKDVAVKDNVMVTISHIKIGPSDICPAHCIDPTTGLKCYVPPPTDSEQGRIKVSSTNNPRRGVFELVVRKLTGAPLATNELLLEWKPPFSCEPRAPPAPAYLPITRCLPSKCKRIICRPCKPKICLPPSPCSICNACGKPPCRKPCGRPCRSPPCRPVCRKPIICSPVRCCPLPLAPCKPCKLLACKPCKANDNPCRNLCIVGRRRPRKIKSQIKMKSRRTYVSPCLNRSKTCPLVACRSAPSCVLCCKGLG